MKSSTHLQSGPAIKIISTIVILLILFYRLSMLSYTLGVIIQTRFSWEAFMYYLEIFVYVMGLLMTLIYLFYWEKKTNRWLIIPLAFFMLHEVVFIISYFPNLFLSVYLLYLVIPSLLFMGCLILIMINMMMKFKINTLSIILFSLVFIITTAVSFSFVFNYLRLRYEYLVLILILTSYQYLMMTNRKHQSVDIYQQLAKLKKLYDEQYLSKEEYEIKRRQLIERI